MTEQIKISIIVPAYNVERWLQRCVDSILAQTHSNWELILIDDGSTDATGEIIDRYAERDSRIMAVHQPNAGLVAVREKGISLATGMYVGFVDGDDAIDPDMYARLLGNALEHRADISHCGMRMCFDHGGQELHYGTGALLVHDRLEGLRELLSGERIEPSLCNKLYRRELLEGSCLDETVLHNEDFLRNFLLFQRSERSVFEDFCGYQYWVRANSMSTDDKIVLRSRNVLRARKLVLESSEPPERPYTLKCWLSAQVTAINTLTWLDDPQARALCAECRSVLAAERKNLGLLIRRQRLAARLILLSPKLHRLVYRLYRKE